MTRSHRHTRRGGVDSSDFRSRRATGGRRGRGAISPGSVGATREVCAAAEVDPVLSAASPRGPATSRSPRGAGSRAPDLGTGRATVSGSGSASSAARKASTVSRLGVARGLSEACLGRRGDATGSDDAGGTGGASGVSRRGAERGGSGCLASAAVTRRSKVCRQTQANVRRKPPAGCTVALGVNPPQPAC
jgi:hypothetical protein